jgi:hypothetical protein
MTNGAYVPAFARHETFYPRYGWLRKSVVAATEDPAVFHSQEATVTLGVGKNMVRAIRYWGRAFGLLDEAPLVDRPRLNGATPTRLGTFLLGPDGADPYLESNASLWLLHWQLARPGSIAPVWYLTFNRFPHREFDEDLLVDWLDHAVRLDGVSELARSSLVKDASCLLRMYSPPPNVTSESLASPFTALRLVDRVGTGRYPFRITYGPKVGLPPELVGVVALHQLAREPGARSVGLAALVTAEGSPGRVFALSESEVASALDDVARVIPGVTLGVLLGARRLLLDASPEDTLPKLLARLYPDHPFELSLGDLAAHGRPELAA